MRFNSKLIVLGAHLSLKQGNYMALETVTVYTAAPLDALPPSDFDLVSASLASTDWSAFTLQLKITNGDYNYNASDEVKICYAQTVFSENDMTVQMIKPAASSFTIALPQGPEDVSYFTTPILMRTGDTIYVWLEHEAWNSARVLTMKAVQTIP